MRSDSIKLAYERAEYDALIFLMQVATQKYSSSRTPIRRILADTLPLILWLR